MTLASGQHRDNHTRELRATTVACQGSAQDQASEIFYCMGRIPEPLTEVP